MRSIVYSMAIRKSWKILTLRSTFPHWRAHSKSPSFSRNANCHASRTPTHRERPRGENVGRQRPPKLGGGNLGKFLGENFPRIEVPERYVLNRSKALDIDARAPVQSWGNSAFWSMVESRRSYSTPTYTTYSNPRIGVGR